MIAHLLGPIDARRGITVAQVDRPLGMLNIRRELEGDGHVALVR